MTDSGGHGRKETWDPAGFLMLLLLATVFGGVILFLVHWIWSLIESLR